MKKILAAIIIVLAFATVTHAQHIDRSKFVKDSLEYYIKNGSDLIGLSALDPTTGNIQFKGNTAGMKAHGIDLVLNTQNTRGAINWTSSILFSFTCMVFRKTP